uniref:Uncharacterized protein n=1 Tax=Caenorhabditis japonica TaxID=281687 RepID=A0A8R1IXC8_CAEJA
MFQGPSTIAPSVGLRSQQGRNLPACRLAPRRRLFVADNSGGGSGGNQKMTSSTGISFPPPDYMKKMKENYEIGKIVSDLSTLLTTKVLNFLPVQIYIRRNTPGSKNGGMGGRLSTINSSIRAPSYHATSMSTGSVTLDTSGGAPKYVYRLPKHDFGSGSNELVSLHWQFFWAFLIRRIYQATVSRT